MRIRPLTETSLITNWLTAESGRISTIAKGALRPKSPFRGKLDLFYMADFSFSRSRRSELHTLREVALQETHPILRKDLAALQQASYCAALLEQTTEVDTPLPGMFELMRGFLGSFQADESEPVLPPDRVFAFELRLLTELGLEPNWEEKRISNEGRAAVEHLQTAEWGEISRTPLPAPIATGLRRFLHGFLIYNFGRLARGREAAVGS